MSFSKHMLLLGASLMLSGCFASLHPLYTEADLVSMPELEGVWRDDESIWLFEGVGKYEYRLTYIEDGRPGLFRARLLELEGLLFWDLFPEMPETNDFFKLHLVPAHTFALLDLQGDRLEVGFPGEEFLKAANEAEGEPMPYQELDDEVVLLTASTDRLQDFVRRYAPQAFDQRLELKRLRD